MSSLAPGPGQGVMYPSPCVPAGHPCSAPDRYVSANNSMPDQSDMDTYSTTLEVNWSSTLGDITSITGYKQFELDEYTDQDATPFDLFATRRKTEGWQFSQELRNVIQPASNWELMVGGFAMVTSYEHFQNALFDFAMPGLRVFTPHQQDNWSASIFVQNYIDLTDTLRLQAGLRYTHEYTEMEAKVQNFLNFGGSGVFGGDTFLGGFTAKDDKSWDNIGGKLGLDYQLSEDFLVYGYYARGFKSGGFVGRLGIAEDIGPFDEEYVDTIEAGAKTDWFDRRLRVNIALFQNWYKDIQLASLYFTENDQGSTIQGNSILNAAEAETRGVELDITAVPAAGLTVNMSLAYLHAQYENFPFLDPLTLEVRDLEGFHLQDAPEWTANIGFNYNLPLQIGPGSLEFGMQYKFSDTKFNTAIDNSPRSKIQKTNITDAHIEWTHQSQRWSVELWGRNIFDKRYIASVIDVPPVFANVNYAAPREWGASIKYNW